MGDDNTSAVAYCVAVEAAVDVYQDQCRELRSSLLQWAVPDQTRRDVAGLPEEPERQPSPEDSDEDFSAVLAASAEFVNASAASASGVEAALTAALAASLGSLEKLAEGEASTQLADVCVLADLNANSDLEWCLEDNNGRGECFVLMIKKIRAHFGMTRIGSARLRQYLVAAEGNAAAVQLAAAAVEDARSAKDDPAGEFTAVASLKLVFDEAFYAELEEMKKVGVYMGGQIFLVWLANHVRCPVLFYTENMRIDGSFCISKELINPDDATAAEAPSRPVVCVFTQYEDDGDSATLANHWRNGAPVALHETPAEAADHGPVPPSTPPSENPEPSQQPGVEPLLGCHTPLGGERAQPGIGSPGEDEEMGTAELGTALISTQAPCPYSDEHPNNADDPVCHSQPPCSLLKQAA